MNVHTPSSRLRAGIDELRSGFLDRVAERCLDIEGIVAAAETGGVSEDDCLAIARHAHKTAGVAATFGYTTLGVRAMAVETLISRRGTPLVWDEIGPAIESLLDEMESVLDAASGSSANEG